MAKSLIDPDILEKFENEGLAIVDTEPRSDGDYYELRERAVRKAKYQRLEVETKLISQWRSSKETEDKYLIVDGTLMNFRNEHNIERCIGVSKSFGTRYFNISEQNLIMQMKEFERSWTFQFHAPDEDIHQGPRERISWYLRLRKHKHSDPEFGMVRVEISRKYASNASEYADRFSKSLISERFPTSYPLPRWDKHLYPIKACEDYLSSIMPSIETINASVKG